MGSDFIGRDDLRGKYTELATVLPGLQAILEGGEDINSAMNTPQAIYAVSLLAAEALRQGGIVPDYVAGFSLGEITALAFTESLSFAEGARLLLLRTEAMADASRKNPGAMAAVMGMTDDKLSEILQGFPQVYAVNFNSPGQTVISGDAAQLAEAVKLVKAEGCKAIVLRVTGAFHSPFMKAAELCLRDHLATVDLNQPSVPIISNMTGKPYPEDREGMKEAIAGQVTSPVRFVDTVEYLYENGVRMFIECGEGKVLTGLVGKTLAGKADISLLNISDNGSLEAALAQLKGNNNV